MKDMAEEALETLHKYLLKQHLTLAVAESVTGGMIQMVLSSLEDATFFFQGGITVYNLGQKVRHLGVDPIHAEKHNCVSELVTQQMARGICGLFLSDIGIAITGYAAPLPEKGITRLFAFYAICRQGEIIKSGPLKTSKHQFAAVQQDYTAQVISKAIEALKT